MRLTLLAVVLLVAASPASALPPAGGAAPAPAPPPQDTAQTLVQEVYGVAKAQLAAMDAMFARDTERTPADDVAQRGPLDEPFLSRFFTPAIAAGKRRDEACQQREEGICNLDFDPISASQDPSYDGLEILSGRVREDRAEVLVTLHAGDSPVRMTYVVVPTAAGPRIADIINATDDWTLRKVLDVPPLR